MQALPDAVYFRQRRQAGELLAQETAEFERSNAELERFAHAVSHDLKAPLFSLRSFAERVRGKCRGKLGATAQGFLTGIVKKADYLELLINDLLAYARATTRAEPFGLVDCRSVLGVVLSNLGTEIEKSDAAITLDELTTVTGDETQFIRLFQNLVGNALKYRSERTPHIHISAKRIQELSGLAFNNDRIESAIHEVRSASGKGWLFSVTDNGIGIDPLYFDRIFQAFQRLCADEKKYPGTGLGLAICKKIVERYGGRMWVDSEPGMGSTFYFTIPSTH